MNLKRKGPIITLSAKQIDLIKQYNHELMEDAQHDRKKTNEIINQLEDATYTDSTESISDNEQYSNLDSNGNKSSLNEELNGIL